MPSLIALATNLVYLYLFYVSYIGVLYLAYNYLIGKPVTIQDTLSAVKKFSGRVIGCSCLSFLAILPLMFWVLAVSLNSSTHSLEIQDKVIIVLMPLSVFAALFPFTIIGFFENDWGIRKSLDKAWYLFKSNFGVLAILGVILAINIRVYTVLSGLLTVIIQSGFDFTSISNLNMLNPSESLSTNLLFVLINGIGQIVFTPLSASIFISAYLKYKGVKLPFQMRIK